MKYDYSILSLCANLEVSPSGYSDWPPRRTAPGPRAAANQTLAKQSAAIHVQSRQTYGSPRIVDTLRKQGARHGRNRIARLLRKAGLCGRQKGRYRAQTTDSNHDHPIAPNRMAQAPKATQPNQIWVGDITDIETQEGWLYLAAILDRYSRQLVGWAMSERRAGSKSFGHGPPASATTSQFAAPLRSGRPIRQRTPSARDFQSPVDFELLNN